MKPHKHAELIKQWADGAEIQERPISSIPNKEWSWADIEEPVWSSTLYEWRIKPDPKPDMVKMFQANFQYAFEVKPFDANLKLTFDGETGKLKSAEALK